jgi:hypothetical protein
MKKTFLGLSVAIIAASLLLGFFFVSNEANSRNENLNTDIEKLQESYDALEAKYYSLLGNFSALEYNYQNLLLQNPFAVANPGSSGTADTQQMLSRYQALQHLYTNLQTEYNRFVTNYRNLKSMTDQRLMQGDLKSLITPHDPAVVSLTYNITGKVNVTDAEKEHYLPDIKAIYNWVNDNIEYREDGLYPKLPEDPAEAMKSGLLQSDQTAQLPNETLHVKMGDCEDMAVLLTSMIRTYFDNRLVECIWITGENAGHVAVVIPFGGEHVLILDPIRDYYSHNTLGEIWYNSISSEIYNWMQIWRPSLGNDVHVYRVFSDYIDQYFEDTEEYINWMYNR